jgi:hypothetical protein
LQASTQAYARASQLHGQVAARMSEVEARTQRHLAGSPRVRRGGPAPEVAAARRLLRSPRSARQAIIVSVVLGAPKALD